MYNTAQKEQFIREYSTKISVRTQAKQLFDLFEPYEERWGGDLCTQDIGELQAAFDKLTGFRETSRNAPRTILKRYAQWCIDKDVPEATDSAMHLDCNSIGTLKNRMVRNPRHLQSIFDIICEPENEQTSDNDIRTYYWMAYAGMEASDILTVKSSDVDFEKMVVSHNGIDYPIYREAIPSIRNCVKLTEFRYKHPNYPDKIIWKDRVAGDVLIRGIRSIPTVSTMQVELSRRLKKANDEGKTEMKLSYFRIWLSGIFYRMLEDELAGFPVDFSSFVDNKLGEFQYSVREGGNTQECKRRQLALSYQNDYERWKHTLL